MKNLLKWKRFADSRITPIENIKVLFQNNLKILDKNHPNWKSYFQSTNDYLKHDARREYFVSVRVILQNAQLSFIFIRDQLTDEKWYIKQINQFNLSAALQALREQALMIKYFTFHSIAMCTEETMRAIVRSDNSNCGVDPKGAFKPIYDKIILITSLQKYLNLFEILRLARNTIHTNGIFSPRNNKNENVSYKNRTFKFEVGNILNWIDDEFPIWIANELNTAMFNIITSSQVSSINYCPRGFK